MTWLVLVTRPYGRNVIHHILGPCLLRFMLSCDVASVIYLACGAGRSDGQARAAGGWASH